MDPPPTGTPPPPWAPPPPPASPAPGAPEATLDLHGALTLQHGGYSGGLAFRLEGEQLGFDLGFDAFEPGSAGQPVTHPGGVSGYGLFTLHGALLLLRADAGRLRAEAGLSVLTWPDAGPDAGSVALGPDLGLSGDLRLAGPLGVTAHVRATPYPTPVLDWQAALAVEAGVATLTAGWRELSVHTGAAGDNVSRFAFAGPQLGVRLGF